MKTLKIFLAVLLFATISFAQDNYTSVKTGEQIDNGIRPYKVYTALLTQAGTDAPVAIILENTLGITLTWSRSGTGTYSTQDILALEILLAKVFVSPIKATKTAPDENNYIYFSPIPGGVSNDTVQYFSMNTQDGDGTGSDDVLVNFPIEIRVYP